MVCSNLNFEVYFREKAEETIQNTLQLEFEVKQES